MWLWGGGGGGEGCITSMTKVEVILMIMAGHQNKFMFSWYVYLHIFMSDTL